MLVGTSWGSGRVGLIKEMVDDSRESKECMKTINERNEDEKGQGKLERKVGKGKNGKGDGGGKERWNAQNGPQMI